MNRSVLVVGGLDRLVSHYEEIARVYGCRFYHHNGNCKGGKKKLYRLVGQAGVVFCPIDITSHMACGLVKKMCKEQGKALFFLRSSGLSSFKEALNKWLERQEDSASGLKHKLGRCMGTGLM